MAESYVYEAEVRDSELDIQGIVNNSNYMVYMEHARHKYLKHLGVDFKDMHDRGFDLVLFRTEIDFKDSLKSDDEFFVVSKLNFSGRARFVFEQQILRKSDKKIMTNAKNYGVCVDRSIGKVIVPDQLKEIVGQK